MTKSSEHGNPSNFHDAGVYVTKKYLKDHGWEIVDDKDLYACFDGEKRYPDIVAEKKDGSGKNFRRTRIIVEVESQDKKDEMGRREMFYVDTYPPKADAFYVIPLWKVVDKDRLSSIRKVVEENLP